MKKIVFVPVLLLLAVFLLAGCQTQPETTPPPATSVESSTDAPEAQTGEDGQPVTGESLVDGVYSIEAESSSSMFRIVDAQLLVEDGRMSAVLTLSGTGYLCLYLGTGQEAETAAEQDFINYVEDDQGRYTYTVPVEALNQEIDCAAYSIRKETWYDRVLVFDAKSLPAEAWKNTAADAPADGNYTADVTLTGGSGRAAVTSPASLTVQDGRITAAIQWSSPNYDYMKVDGTKYDPVNTEGNAAFEIPVAGLDREIPVIADTTAMSQPHEVAYTLRFSASSLERTAP